MATAMKMAKVPFDKKAEYKLVIKSVSAKQRPRRPASAKAKEEVEIDGRVRDGWKRRRELGFATRAIHDGQAPDELTGAVNVPIYLTSTYQQEAIGKNKGHEYARLTNPTRDALEENLCSLEGGTSAHAFGSGMAAITAMCTMMKSGDHVVCTDNMYGGTGRLFDKVLANYGLTFTYVDTSVAENVAGGDYSGDEAGAYRDADESDDVDYGYRGGGEDLPCEGCGVERRQYVSVAVSAAADRAGCGYCDALDDEVFEWALGWAGWRAGLHEAGAGGEVSVCAEVHGWDSCRRLRAICCCAG